MEKRDRSRRSCVGGGGVRPGTASVGFSRLSQGPLRCSVKVQSILALQVVVGTTSSQPQWQHVGPFSRLLCPSLSSGIIWCRGAHGCFLETSKALAACSLEDCKFEPVSRIQSPGNKSSYLLWPKKMSLPGQTSTGFSTR